MSTQSVPKRRHNAARPLTLILARLTSEVHVVRLKKVVRRHQTVQRTQYEPRLPGALGVRAPLAKQGRGVEVARRCWNGLLGLDATNKHDVGHRGSRGCGRDHQGPGCRRSQLYVYWPGLR